MTRPNLLEWLVACWYVQRITRRLLFSKRAAFFDALRPLVIEYGQIIFYPEAFLFIRVSDVERAIAAAEKVTNVRAERRSMVQPRVINGYYATESGGGASGYGTDRRKP